MSEATLFKDKIVDVTLAIVALTVLCKAAVKLSEVSECHDQGGRRMRKKSVVR